MCGKSLRSGVLVLALATAAAVATAAAAAESSSALLERAIYTEETVGDLPAAAKLYERVVAEAKRGEPVAAKAQYRLGLCLLKQGKREQGIAALEEVARRFPDQKELVAAARKHTPTLPAIKLRPPVWSEGESLQYRGRLDDGQELGTFVCSVEPATLHGKKIWRFRWWGCGRANSIASRVDADFDSLMPINSSTTDQRVGKLQARIQIRARESHSEYSRGRQDNNTVKSRSTPTPYDQRGVSLCASAACRWPRSSRRTCPSSRPRAERRPASILR